MSEAFVNQVTLDCLLNKQMYSKQIRTKKAKQINNEERKLYRKRIFHLFKKIIYGDLPDDLSPDVKYAYDNFMNATIQHFKIIDNNDMIQTEYKDEIFTHDISSNIFIDCSNNLEPEKNHTEILKTENLDVDILLTRSIKLDVSTLDKYVTKTRKKKL
jgi:hypothetical protein